MVLLDSKHTRSNATSVLTDMVLLRDSSRSLPFRPGVNYIVTFSWIIIRLHIIQLEFENFGLLKFSNIQSNTCVANL